MAPHAPGSHDFLSRLSQLPCGIRNGAGIATPPRPCSFSKLFLCSLPSLHAYPRMSTRFLPSMLVTSRRDCTWPPVGVNRLRLSCTPSFPLGLSDHPPPSLVLLVSSFLRRLSPPHRSHLLALAAPRRLATHVGSVLPSLPSCLPCLSNPSLVRSLSPVFPAPYRLHPPRDGVQLAHAAERAHREFVFSP